MRGSSDQALSKSWNCSNGLRAPSVNSINYELAPNRVGFRPDRQPRCGSAAAAALQASAWHRLGRRSVSTEPTCNRPSHGTFVIVMVIGGWRQAGGAWPGADGRGLEDCRRSSTGAIADLGCREHELCVDKFWAFHSHFIRRYTLRCTNKPRRSGTCTCLVQCTGGLNQESCHQVSSTPPAMCGRAQGSKRGQR